MPGLGSRTGTGATSVAVARLFPVLTPVAVLLTDDPEEAVRLLGAALGAPGALEDPATARSALAHHAEGRTRWSAEQVIETTTPVVPADDDAALAGALSALPTRDRVAVVLGDATGSVLSRFQGDLARRDEQAQRERLLTAELYRAPGSPPAPPEPAAPLPDRLARLAAGRPLPPGALETIVAEVGEARRRRRRRRLPIAAGVVVAAMLVVLGSVLPRQVEDPGTVFGEPTRGALAGDAEFVRAMEQAPWPGAPGTSDPRRVVFVDDVPGGRWALVAAGGTRERPAAIAWFTGPSGASPDRMTLAEVRATPDPALPVALTRPATGALVVVTAPGDRIAVSARPDVDADGSITRSFRNLQAPDGVAVSGLTPVPDATVSAARLEVTRDDRRLDVRPRTVVADPAAPVGVLHVLPLRPSTASVAEDPAVISRLRSVLGQLGEVTSFPVTALWSGELPGVNHRATRLSVLTVERPSGALVVTAPYSYAADPSGRPGSSWCATGVLPAGPPLEQRVVAVRCDLRDQSIQGQIYRFLVVVGPRTAVSARLLDEQGALLSEHPLDDGVAVIRSPGPVAEVAVTTAEGGTATAVPFVDSTLPD